MHEPLNPPILPSLSRDDAGRFLPGSGGRAPGSRNIISKAAIAEIHNLSGSALKALKDNLAAGDQRAAEYVLNKILPAGRVVEIDATSQGITDALADGSLSVAELKDIAAAIGSLKNLSDLESVRNDVAELRKLLRG